jgi:hypothetical protein
MKITKSRLLQIIREEVELHEKNSQPEDLNDASTENPVETDKDGNVKNPKDVLKRAAGGELEEDTTAEDQIIKKGNGVIKPKPNKDKLEIKIR